MTLIKGAGGGGCFRAGTRIQQEFGRTVSIENIILGTEVLSYDDAGNISVSTVTEVHYHKELEPLIRIEFWGGYVDITPNHWVLNQYGSFVEAGSLSIKDAFIDGMGHLRPIKNIYKISSESVWNLTVFPNHTFIANDIRVHNGGYKNRFPVVSGSGGGGGSSSKGGGGAATATVASRTPVEDPDTLRSIQYVRVLDLVSEGEIEGLVNGLQSIYIDDTPLQRSDGKFNFSNVKVVSRPGTQTQEYIPGFTAVESEVAVGVEVSYGLPITRSILTPYVDAARITIQIPQLTSQNTTNGDLNGTSVEIAIQINNNNGGWVPARVVIGKFPLTIGALTRGTMADGFITTRLVDTDGTQKIARAKFDFTYTGKVPATAEEKTSLQGGQWVIEAASFSTPNTWVDYAYGEFAGVLPQSLTNAQGVTTWAAPIFKGSTEFDLPSQDHWHFRIIYRDAYLAYSGTLNVSSAVGSNWTHVDKITGKTTSPYQKSYEIPLNGSGPWQIRLTRITPDSTSTALQNQTWWSSYTEITNTRLTYPNSALFGVTVNAQQFKSIPTRGYDIKGLKIRIPRNYNPITREYHGVWDGTFKIEWSDNPAWCFYDMLVESRYGLGEYIDESQIDKWALYEIAKYCDEMIPSGFGTELEPRFTCNLYLQTQEEAYKVINAMASIFRGMAYWLAGSIVAVQDAPADAVALFTAANVIDGMFSYQGASIKARHTAALVTWGDPKLLYRPAIEYVEDLEGIAKYGLITTDVIAVGCTSRGQAHRLGKWLLFSERLESEILSFRTGLQGLVVQPGQIIRVSDPIRTGTRMGGRVVTGSTSSITLDSTVTITKGNHTLTIQLPDGTIETRTVTTVPTSPATSVSTSTLTVSPVFSGTPQAQSMWILAKTNVLDSETWRIISVTEVNSTEAEITAIAHNPSKYANIEKDISLETYNTYGLDITESLPPSGLTVVEALYAATPSTAGIDAIISWSGTSPSYIFEWKREDSNWIIREVLSTSYEIKPAPPGNYNFKVTAISALGVKSETVILENYYIGNSLLVPPSDIPTVNATYEGKTIWLDWGSVTDLRGITYEVRWGDTWGSGVVFPMGNMLRFKTRGDGDYWVKAVTGNGVYSTNPKGIRIEGSSLVDNVIAVIDEDATGWSGTHNFTYYSQDGLSLSGSALWSSITSFSSISPSIIMLGGFATQGYYTIPDSSIVDIGSPGSCQITSALTYNIHDSVKLVSEITMFSTIPSLLMSEGGTGSLSIEINMAQGDGVYAGWQTFVPGDYYARYYKFRLNLSSTHQNISPYIQNWDIMVDVPDRIVSEEVITPAGALAITFTKPFNVAPKVQATIQNALPGDDIVITSITTTGMSLTIKNGGASVARTVHYLAQGY